MKRLSGWDAVFVYSETFNVPTHTLKIAVIDRSGPGRDFTFDVFRRVVARRLPVLEPLRYQLVGIPLRLHHPMWLENPKVDLDCHLHRIRVPSPGGRRELDDVSADIARTPLDRGRPLWEAYFVDDMAADRVAVITKVHHALADGVASANLLARAMDPKWPNEQKGEVSSTVPPSTKELLAAAGRDHVKQLKRLPAVVRDTVAGARRLRTRSTSGRRPTELPAKTSPPPTFMNHKVSAGRRFATATLSLAEVKQTSKHFGVTINDLMLAVSSGMLRDLLIRYDGSADQPIVASVAITTDPSPDRISGNALGGLIVSLPVHLVDPLERVRVTRVATVHAKETNQLLGPDLMDRWTHYVPPAIAPWAFRRMERRGAGNALYNFSFSNVPGPRERGHIGGATIGEFYSVGPLTPGSALNVTVWSYVDQLNISVLTDDITLQDAHEATDAMVTAFAEIRRAAGFSGELARVETAMAQAVRKS